LDAYRGIAALAVVIFHAGGPVAHRAETGRSFYDGTPLDIVIRQFSAGVTWFFVLSGFVIFLPFARAAIRQTAPVAVLPFLARRAIRLLPLYYFTFTLIWLAVRGSVREPWRDLALHLTFTHVFSREHFLWTIGPAWSLGVEVMFYLFVAACGPLAHRVCARLPTPRARSAALGGGVAALACASLAYVSWAHFAAGIAFDDLPVYSGPVAMFHTFAPGMGLAIIVALTEGRTTIRHATAALLLTGWVALSLVAIVTRLDRAWAGLYFNALFGLAFALLLATTVLGRSGARWGRVLLHPVLQFLGLISYSVYLWHESITWVLFRAGVIGNRAPHTFPQGILLVCVVVIAVSAASYWAIERPTMRLRARLSPDRRVAPPDSASVHP
jgi:peptidoglycan/LPS O-acetylase OafA/YrhL